MAEKAGEPLEGLVYVVGTINLRSLQRLGEADFLRKKGDVTILLVILMGSVPLFLRADVVEFQPEGDK